MAFLRFYSKWRGRKMHNQRIMPGFCQLIVPFIPTQIIDFQGRVARELFLWQESFGEFQHVKEISRRFEAQQTLRRVSGNLLRPSRASCGNPGTRWSWWASSSSVSHISSLYFLIFLTWGRGWKGGPRLRTRCLSSKAYASGPRNTLWMDSWNLGVVYPEP